MNTTHTGQFAKPGAISGLNGDSVRAVFGEASYLDLGRDAVVNEGVPLVRLQLILNPLVPDYSNRFEHIEIDTSDGRIVLSDGSDPGSTITVDGTTIGSINRASDQRVLWIDFNQDATPALIQQFVRSLTYTNSSEDDFIAVSDIQILTRNAEGLEEDFLVDVMTTPAAAPADEFILTRGADIFQGTDGNDSFYYTLGAVGLDDEIDGGEGDDTFALYIPDNSTQRNCSVDISMMNKFTGVEFIDGTRGNDDIRIRADQLSGILEIGGFEGDDRLQITGTEIDLTSIDVIEFEEISLSDDGATITLSNVETAKLVSGYNAQGETVIITSGTLTDAERVAIHRQGIDTIITQEDGVTTTHDAPKVIALDGDQIRISTNETVFLDVGRDAVLTADDGILGYLEVSIVNGADEGDLLRFDTPDGGPITISDGYQNFSRISVNGIEIGAFNNFTRSAFLAIQLYENATPDLVQILLRALTYTNTNGSIGSRREIEITLQDMGGRSTSATVTVNPWEWSADKVTEGMGDGITVGTLAGVDSGGNTLEYTLTGTSAEFFELMPQTGGGYQVVVKAGIILDYENSAHRSFSVIVSNDSNTAGRTFDLALVDVNEAPTLTFTAVDVNEGANGGTIVGTLTATDPEDNELEYMLSAESAEFFELSPDDNGNYTVKVKDGVVLDYENPAHRSFTVTVTDLSNPDVTLTFNLDLANTNESPALSFAGTKIVEGVQGGTVIGTLIGQDPEGQPLQYTLLGASANLFELRAKSGGYDVVVKAGIVLDYETLAHRSFGISVSDGANAVEKTFALDLENRNEAPIASFASVAVKEGSVGGTTVGNLWAADPEGSALSYALTGASADLFDLVTDANGGYRIVVKQGLALDYETSAHHKVSVSVSDGANTTQKTFTLDLTDEIDLVTGTARNDVLTGQSGSDILKGLAGNDRLHGGSGDDRIYGDLGNDSLEGGGGQDIFVFDTKPGKASNKDRIVDFSVKDDAIWLDNAVFPRLGAGTEGTPMQLRKDFFIAGAKAKDRNDYVVYDKTKGVLFYDADGSGRGKAVEIATLSKNLKMTNKDFFVI